MNNVILMVIIYLTAMILIGLIYRKKASSDGSGYLVANRSISSFIGGGALASTYSSTSGFLGTLGLIYVSGLAPTIWGQLGLLLGFTVSAVFVAPKLRGRGLSTFSEFFGKRYSQKVRTIAALVTFITMFVYIIAQLQGGAYAMQFVLGIPYSVAVLLIGAIFIAYVALGGSYASIVSSFIQNLMMVTAMVTVALVAIFSQSWDATYSNAVNHKPFLFDIWGAQGPLFSLSFGLLLGLGVMCAPHVSVLFLSARDVKTAKRTTAAATTYLSIFFASTFFVGSYIVARFPDLQNPDLGYFAAIETLPSIIFGLFVAAVIAAAMSTTDAQLLSAASAITNDLYQSVSGKTLSKKKTVFITRLTVLIVGVLATLVTLNPPGLIVLVMALAQSLMVGAFLGPLLLGIWWRKTTTSAAFYGMIGGFLVAMLTHPVIHLVALPSPFLSGPIGALVSLIIMVTVTLRENKHEIKEESLSKRKRSTVS